MYIEKLISVKYYKNTMVCTFCEVKKQTVEDRTRVDTYIHVIIIVLRIS